MSYGGYAASVKSKATSLNYVLINVNGIDFEENWKSTAGQKLIASLDNVVSKINTEKGNLQTFASAIARIDELVAMDKQIASLSAQLSVLNPDDDDDAAKIAFIKAEIARIRAEKEALKQTIIGILGGFGSVGTEYSLLYSGSISVDWDQLSEKVEEFSALGVGNIFKALTKYDENGNVIRDGEEYFNSVINSIKQQYTGIERNYLVSMAIIDLSLEAGVRIPYVHAGTSSTGNTVDTRIAVPTSTLAGGVDCNAFASYVIFDENSTEKWLEVGQFKYAGESVPSYELAQAGDIFANGKHVGMIVANNPETGEAIILHASGTDTDMKLQTVNYNYFKSNGHQIRRVDSTYVSPTLANIIGEQPSSTVGTLQTASIDSTASLNSTNNTVVNTNFNTNTNASYTSNYAVGNMNLNGNVYNGVSLTAPQGLNVNGPTGSETWYDLDMSGVVKNMEKLYRYTDLEASIRDDGVKVLSGVTPDGERFEDLVMVAADVEHASNPNGTFKRGEIVPTSLGTGIVVDACGRSINERKSTGNVHFDIATAWGTEPYHSAAYGKNDSASL